MNNNQALGKIMKDLESGEHYGRLSLWDNHHMEYFKHPTFHDVLYKHGKYVYWNHGGSSANEFTSEDVLWIIQHIFQMEPVEFLKNYYTEGRAKAAVMTAPIIWDNL